MGVCQSSELAGPHSGVPGAALSPIHVKNIANAYAMKEELGRYVLMCIYLIYLIQ